MTIGEHTILEVLDLEEIDRDLYRSTLVFDAGYNLYGGQVLAQALLAAGRTVPEDRMPHSLHGYFLRVGATGRPTIFRVDRDRDGRSFSARRVVAVQGGEVILNMSASFHTGAEGDDQTLADPVTALAPGAETRSDLNRMFSVELRTPQQFSDPTAFPPRIWGRCTEELPDDPLVHAAVLTYLSDASSAFGSLEGAEERLGPSLDHAMWFLRAARADEWVLMDLVPQSVSGGRGWYTGSITTADGMLVASIAQECLWRNPR